MIKAFIFDSDGVIINSEPEYMKQNMAYMDSVGIPYGFSDVKRMVGSHENLQIEYFQKHHPRHLGFEETRQEWYQFINDHPFAPKDVVNPNIDTAVRYLKDKGYKVAIASNSGQEYVENCARDAGVLDYMEFVLSGLGMAKPKPDPDIYLIAAEKLGVRPEECVVIEDSTFGIEAGSRAGMKVIALVEHIYGTDQHEADYIIDDLIEICDIEKEMAGNAII